MNVLGKELAAKGVGLKFSTPSDIDSEELSLTMEQYHRESRTIPKRRMDIDR